MNLNSCMKKGLVDRSGWPNGQWDEEPQDFVAWNSAQTGYRCWLRRSSDGHWCGYVGVPVSHPLSGVSLYDVPALTVHGGITYSEARVFENVKGEAVSGWCFGFDCNHFEDQLPASRSDIGTYRSYDYALDQTASLCADLYLMELENKVV